MRKCLTLIITLSIVFHLMAQDNPKAGARALALSGAVISFSDPWATFHNQAGLAQLETISGAVFYSSEFLIKELSQMAATAVVPTKSGVFGLSFSQFGTGGYKEIKTGIAFGKKLSDSIRLPFKIISRK